MMINKVVITKGKDCQITKRHNLELKVLSPRGFINDNISVAVGKTKKGEFVNTNEDFGYELVYVIKGKCIFKQGNTEYELEECDLIYHDGSIPHSITAVEPHIFLGLHFVK